MALLFMDGFSHYTDFQDKWDYELGTPVIQGSGGRFSGDSVQFNASGDQLAKIFSPGLTEIIVGFALKITNVGVSDRSVILFQNSNFITHAQLEITNTETIEVLTGGVIRGESSTILVENDWYYVEFKFAIGSPNGSYELRINGVTELSDTSVDTINGTTGEQSVSFIELGLTGTSNPIFEVDDFYIADTTGSNVNDFVGSVTIETLFPSGVGNTTNFATNAATNHAAVLTNPPDDDTSRNSSSTATNKDTFAFDDMTATAGTIHGVQVTMNTRKQDAGLREMSDVVRRSAVDYDGSNFAISQGYDKRFQIREVDPSTSSAWDIAGVNAAEFGYKLQT